MDFSTFDDMATGEDYMAASGQLLSWWMSTAAQTASVLIQGDLQFEPDETFFVQPARRRREHFNTCPRNPG